MSRSLPRRPDIEQLRRQAKELRDAAHAGQPAALNRFEGHVGPVGHVTLSLAQLVLAREHGFPSWTRLKAAVGATATPDLPVLVDDFLAASVEGRITRAARLLRDNPAIATYDISTAAVLGDQPSVLARVHEEPAVAILPDTRRGWPPLLYACHSAWHRVDPDHAEGILQVVWLLLDTGANPNTTNGRPAGQGHRSALFGAAGIAANAAVTSLLLRYGADPDDDESLYHAARHADRACLRVLLGHGATVGGSAFAAAVTPGNAEGVRLMIESGGDPGRPRPDGVAEDGYLADGSLAPLPLAVARCGVDVVEQLLAAGADPNAAGTDHRSAIRRAVRRGNNDVARLLRRNGARDDTTEVDNFLGACLRADRAAANQLLSLAPGLPRRLTAEDLGTLVDAAEHADPAAVLLMLDLGFPIGARREDDGATPLHAAAYAGRSTVVALLLDRGADVRTQDGRWGASALAWATAGAVRSPGTPATWTGSALCKPCWRRAHPWTTPGSRGGHRARRSPPTWSSRASTSRTTTEMSGFRVLPA